MLLQEAGACCVWHAVCCKNVCSIQPSCFPEAAAIPGLMSRCPTSDSCCSLHGCPNACCTCVDFPRAYSCTEVTANHSCLLHSCAYGRTVQPRTIPLGPSVDLTRSVIAMAPTNEACSSAKVAFRVYTCHGQVYCWLLGQQHQMTAATPAAGAGCKPLAKHRLLLTMRALDPLSSVAPSPKTALCDPIYRQGYKFQAELSVLGQELSCCCHAQNRLRMKCCQPNDCLQLPPS
jgi:hypothetical protein